MNEFRMNSESGRKMLPINKNEQRNEQEVKGDEREKQNERKSERINECECMNG